MNRKTMKKVLVVIMVLAMIAAMTTLVFAATADKFTDITSHWAKSDITALVERGMFNGISDIAFDPEGTMSRAMVATVLYRYDGEKAVGTNAFTDVPAGIWYADAAVWAVENGIIAGTTATTFAPNTAITREGLANALYSYAKYKDGSGTITNTTNKTLRLSTTTSVNDAGLLGYLQKTFEADTGYKLEVSSAGTGAAITKGRGGDADILLVHAKANEEAFIAEGFGEERVPFMFNYFVIIGPANDPAGVKNCTSASEAFKKIAENKDSKFVSRGDESGTHVAEKNLWTAAGITPTGQDWYNSTGSGMGASITIADQQGAYILTDKATYLAHEARDKFEILLEESDEMINTYSMIAISENRFDDTNSAGAAAFIDWMTSKKAADLINAYGLEDYNETLFYTLLGTYSDNVGISDACLEAVNWAVGVGIIVGVTDTTIVPTGNATRAEVVTMLNRFLTLIEK